MARIRMMETITGGRYDGRVWPPLGGALHVPEWEAGELVAAGHAVYEEDPALAAPAVPDDGGGLPPVPPVPRAAPDAAPAAPSAVARAELPGGGSREAAAVAMAELPGGDPQEAAAGGDSAGEDGSASADGDEDDGDEDDGIPRPAVNHPKSAWVEYAVARGADRAGVEGKTKADLMSEFGPRL